MKTDSKEKYYIYIGFVSSNDLALKVQESLAGNDAEINFISKILYPLTDNGKKLKVISYAHNIYLSKLFRKKILKETTFDLITEPVHIKASAIPIINFKVFRQIYASNYIYKYIDKILKIIKKNGNIKNVKLIVCNSYPILARPTLKLAKKYNIDTVLYSIDGFYNQDSNNLFQRYNTRAAIKHFKQFDSVITLSQNVIDDFASSQQKTVSITPIESDLYKDESSNVIDTSKVKLLFTGGVAELNGINQYLEAMKYLPKNFELTIYGRGVLVDKVIESSKTDSRIIYGGVMIKSDVIKKQTESDILLIVRPMINGEQNNITKYGIPYKLIEYLASGTPIIASDMLAIPHSLRRFINFTETNPQSIAKSIESVVGNYKHHKKLALEARNTMINYRNWNYYYEILKDFINE